MATIRETILKVKPGKQKIIPLSEVDVTGYRQQAHVISKELRDKGVVVPGGKPAYTISKNKYTGSMYIINGNYIQSYSLKPLKGCKFSN